jgi:hypothetical protein
MTEALQSYHQARILRHHGVNNGKTKKKMATAVITPDIGRFKKIINEP